VGQRELLMSQWHRDNPELVGTDADPWMRHESYRRLVPTPAEPLEERPTEEKPEAQREAERHLCRAIDLILAGDGLSAWGRELLGDASDEFRRMSEQ
jgi:hypothetical protein